MNNFDNEDKIIIKEHDWYYTPGDFMCERYLQRAGLKPDSAEFLKELSRYYYHQMIDDRDYLKKEFKDLDKLPEDIDAASVADKMAFYEEIFDEYIPGYSPIEKAINTLKMIAKEKKENPKKEQTLMQMLPGMRENKPDKETFECKTWDTLLNKRGLDDFDNKLKYLQKVGIVEGFGKTFDIKKTITEKKTHNSIQHKSKRLTEYSELTKSPIYQRIFPNYFSKLLNKDLVINAPIKTEESKQKIIILVDFSGSMNDPFKQEWVLSIVADRLYYAMKEECEIFFSFFVEDLYPSNKFVHIYNEKTALDFFQKFNTNPSGGDTYVGDVINKIKYEIENNHKLFNLNIDLSKDKPEILVINDGQDSVKVSEFSWKTNAITLGGHNGDLKKLCHKSDGRYLTIDHKGKIAD